MNEDEFADIVRLRTARSRTTEAKSFRHLRRSNGFRHARQLGRQPSFGHRSSRGKLRRQLVDPSGHVVSQSPLNGKLSGMLCVSLCEVSSELFSPRLRRRELSLRVLI